MTRHVECPFEEDVLDALRTGRWPVGCQASLRTHVEACQTCTDLVEVASALLDGHEPAAAADPMPSAELVWCRAQLRARQDAARAAARPIALAQGIALGCATGLAMAVLSVVWPWAASWTTVLYGQLVAIDVGTLTPGTLQLLLPRQVLVALGLFVLVVIVPATAFIVLSDEP